MATKISNWKVSLPLKGKPLSEQPYITLKGEVSGHPELTDGEYASTSPVTSFNGTTIKTRSRDYELGAPSQSYLDWLTDEGLTYDPANPLAAARPGVKPAAPAVVDPAAASPGGAPAAVSPAPSSAPADSLASPVVSARLGVVLPPGPINDIHVASFFAYDPATDPLLRKFDVPSRALASIAATDGKAASNGNFSADEFLFAIIDRPHGGTHFVVSREDYFQHHGYGGTDDCSLRDLTGLIPVTSCEEEEGCFECHLDQAEFRAFMLAQGFKEHPEFTAWAADSFEEN